jgi:chromosome partitioning protein
MIITVASFKGGVGKTTTAVHIAAYLQQKAQTLLIDGDPNRSASGWAKRGELPFKVIDERQAARFSREYEHIVVDTQARPTREDLEALTGGCDLLVIPSTPDSLALEALALTVDTLKEIGSDKYKVLLTVIPPKPNKDGEEAREMLLEVGFPIFAGGIRRFIAFQRAALNGVLVSEISDPNATEGWNDYQAIGREILP